MKSISSNKTIAKNTIMLYFRMMVTMFISLFTSRVILQKLGVDDYGLYQAVGGIVGFLSFINGALSTGSSRFLTYALGEGNIEKLKKTFSTTLSIHILIALLVVIIGETAGLWFLNNKMVIPADRLDAAFFVFHMSILTAVFTITQVPYNALIISHERMTVFAYISIVEIFAKLLICYMLILGSYDRLMLYAALLFIVQTCIMLFYRFYCTHHFEESHFSFSVDKCIFKNIASFSGWSMFANVSIALNSQGILLLLNNFFAPAVVASRAISLQVNGIVNQFVNNFRTAVNPQITKRLAMGDLGSSKKLLLESTKVSFFLVYIIGLPIIFCADRLIKIWLGITPDYSVPFLQLIIVQNFFDVFNISFYQALYAKGRIRENAIISPLTGFIRFPIVYYLFKQGYSPLVLSYMSVLSFIILGLLIKPYLIVKYASYKWKEIINILIPCFNVSILSLITPLLSFFYIYPNIDSDIIAIIIQTLITIISVAVCVWCIGINDSLKKYIIDSVMLRIQRRGSSD